MNAPAPKFHVSAASPELIDRARLFYSIYTDNAHNLNYQGLQCPSWEGLGESVQSHWCAVVRVASDTERKLTAERDVLRLRVEELKRQSGAVEPNDDPDSGGQRK